MVVMGVSALSKGPLELGPLQLASEAYLLLVRALQALLLP